jgi:hypothetical protein
MGISIFFTLNSLQFILLAIFFGLFAFATLLNILEYLKKKNIEVKENIGLLFHINYYLNYYQNITVDENGRIGTLFYYWVMFINCSILFCFFAFLDYII